MPNTAITVPSFRIRNLERIDSPVKRARFDLHFEHITLCWVLLISPEGRGTTFVCLPRHHTGGTSVRLCSMHADLAKAIVAAVEAMLAEPAEADGAA